MAFRHMITRLEEANIEYMVVGSLGSIVYGEPRMTKDFDIVIKLTAKDIRKFVKLFNEEEYYCPPTEVISQEIINHGQFNLIHHESGFKTDILIQKNNPHSIEEFKRKRRIEFIDDLEIFLATPEDIIIKKLVYFKMSESQKHIDDIKGILIHTDIDHDYLNLWLNQLSLMSIWENNF